jgi:hypothetical protein
MSTSKAAIINITSEAGSLHNKLIYSANVLGSYGYRASKVHIAGLRKHQHQAGKVKPCMSYALLPESNLLFVGMLWALWVWVGISEWVHWGETSRTKHSDICVP